MCHSQDCQPGESGNIKSYLKGFHMRSYSQFFFENTSFAEQHPANTAEEGKWFKDY